MKFFKSLGIFPFTIYFLVIWNTYTLYGEDFITVEKRGVLHKFAKMDGGWVDTFTATLFKTWEEETFDTFEIIADKNGVAIDIGAWIGTTAIWLSKNFKHVLAVEADKESTVFLVKNLKASDCKNVTVCPKAVTEKNGTVIFGPRSSISDALNFSTSYVKCERSSENDFTVACVTFNQFLEEYFFQNPALKNEKITFIKCDIEGGEEHILEDILNFSSLNKCPVWMSFHYSWWKSKKIADFKDLFNKFYSICPQGKICEYVYNNPFASVLLIPR